MLAQQLVEFPPVDCDPSEAEDVIGDLVNYVEATEKNAAIYFGKIVVLIKPGEDVQSVRSRFQEQVVKNEQWINRRCGGDRRFWHRDDGHERRSGTW